MLSLGPFGWLVAAVALTVQIACASHSTAVIHRDVKPANVPWKAPETRAAMLTGSECDSPDPNAGGVIRACYSDALTQRGSDGTVRVYGRVSRYDGCHWNCVWEIEPEPLGGLRSFIGSSGLPLTVEW